jgi:RNA polymerase sigma factor (sigma-70 family)
MRLSLLTRHQPPTTSHPFRLLTHALAYTLSNVTHTSISLIQRLRLDSSSADWNRLIAIYTPFLRSWVLRQHVGPTEVDDITQEILCVVVRELATFEHNQRIGAFRAWLRAITVNQLRIYWRQRQRQPRGEGDLQNQLQELEDPQSGVSRLWDLEHDRHVLSRLMKQIEPEFPPDWWQAFRRHVVEGVRATEAAQELGVSVNVVLLAKSRILKRLRQEAAGIVD